MQYILRARKSVVEANFHFNVPPSTRSSPALPSWLCKRVVITSAALMPVSFRHVHTQTQLLKPTCNSLFTSYSSSRFQAFSSRAGRSAHSQVIISEDGLMSGPGYFGYGKLCCLR